MAPPLEYDKEPKAPDKSAATISNEDSKLLHSIVHDQQPNSDSKSANTAANTEVENNKQVVNLDDGQLRALLDEAMNYKCPKDLEGKSNLFKELLEEVQQDEQADDQAGEAAALSAGRGVRRLGAPSRGRNQLLQSNSLQDLVAALAAEPAPRTRARHHPPAPVSARAIQGGSLPSGVDTSFLLGEEPSSGRGAGYLATVRCVNPPPLAERRVSASDANSPAEVELLHRRSKPVFPMTYTARATLEIGSGAVCSGRAVTTTTASNQGDTAIPFSCITTPEVVASCNTTTSTPQSAVAVDPKPLQLGSGYRAVASLTGAAGRAEPAERAERAPDPADDQARQLQVFVPRLSLQPRSVISSSFNGLPLTRPNYGATATSAPEEYKKSLDENGNAVQGFSSPVSGSSQHKKPRRKKSSKNETVIKSDQIDGYKGDKDLNEVLRFIESRAEHGRGKLARKHDDDKPKKRSTERRKDKEKPKRASSLEELSRTKLEDLTEPRPAAPDAGPPSPAVAKPERRSWGDDAREPFYYRAPSPPDPAPAPAPLELTDFQTVTKRRKPRRRADEPERDPPPRRPRPPSPRARRESAPPSDRSNDSNDDLDSVHSLPPDAPPVRPAPAPPPHASYADIARTRHNIPDLIESCNFYAEGDGGAGRRAPGEPPTGGAAGDADYPALGGGQRPPRKLPPRRDRKERPPAPPPPECPAPDVVADRRPPVILLDSAARPRDMDGVTFGFDINEQLLGGPARRPRCDLVRDALDTPAGQTAIAPAHTIAGTAARPGAEGGAGGEGAEGTEGAEGAGGAALLVRGCAALRYVPPAPPHDTRHLHQLVQYVGSAWEDVVRCGGGKVRYFSE